MDDHRKQSVLVIPREVEPSAQFLNCYIFRLGGGLVICSSLGRLLHQVKYQELPILDIPIHHIPIDEGSGREAVCGPWEILDQRNSAAEPRRQLWWLVAAVVAAVSFCSVSSLP